MVRRFLTYISDFVRDYYAGRSIRRPPWPRPVRYPSSEDYRTHPSSLTRVGTNDSGVPIYVGSAYEPPWESIRESVQLGTSFTITSVLLLIFERIEPSGMYLGLAFVFMAFGLVKLLSSFLKIVQRDRTSGLVPIDVLASQAGETEMTILASARQAGVKPRLIINGKEYFRLADLGDAAMLLRPADRPAVDDDHLVRPAAGTDIESNRLVRVADHCDHELPVKRLA